MLLVLLCHDLQPACWHVTLNAAPPVQVRGSIPLYWSQQQQGSRLSKPNILLQTFDPLYTSTRSHFQDMQARAAAALCHTLFSPPCIQSMQQVCSGSALT